MVGEPGKINIKVQGPQQGDVSHTPPLQRPLTLNLITEWIKLQGLDEYTTDGLIDMAATYPNAALVHFRKNFNLMIMRVRAKRKKEMQAEGEET